MEHGTVSELSAGQWFKRKQAGGQTERTNGRTDSATLYATLLPSRLTRSVTNSHTKSNIILWSEIHTDALTTILYNAKSRTKAAMTE